MDVDGATASWQFRLLTPRSAQRTPPPVLMSTSQLESGGSADLCCERFPGDDVVANQWDLGRDQGGTLTRQ
jgi:hypothetical protein